MIPNWINDKFTKVALISLFFLLNNPVAHAKQLLVYGDSISAAYGMELEKGWVHLLDQAWGKNHTVINASISGETTSGGLARLPLTLAELKPDVVLLELGANDGLRGHSIAQISENLEQMINLIKTSGAQVVVAGISVPPSYGPRYIDKFRAIFPTLAKKYDLPFIDFYQEELFLTEGYIQADGLHPTEITQPIIRDTVLKFFEQHKLFE